MKNVIESIKSYLDKFLRWLSTVLPAAATVGSIVYRYMARRLLQKDNKIEELELEKDLRDNRDEVEIETKNMSDSDIIDHAISEGSKLRNKPR